MKKLMVFLLSVLILLPMFACGKKGEETSSSDPNNSLVPLMEYSSTDEHTHDLVSEPQTISEPITGFCGNIVTRIIKDGVEKSFSSGDSVELTSILINLNYSKPMCKCAAEFLVYVETESEPYEVNLSQNFVRFGGKHAELTQQQVETITTILNYYFLEDEYREIIIEKPQDIPVSHPQKAS